MLARQLNRQWRMAGLIGVVLGGVAIASMGVTTAAAEVEVAAGNFARTATPVTVLWEVPAEHADAKQITLVGNDGTRLAAQLTRPGLLAKPATPRTRELHFLLPQLAANQSRRFQIEFEGAGDPLPAFRWQDQPGDYSELRYRSRPVVRYMYAGLDTSTPQRRGETMKVFHHLYDPRGKRLVTKGVGGLFPHHRGLFYGFNKIGYEMDGQQRAADLWHCNRGEWQSHEGIVETEEGGVLGRHRLRIDWHGQDGKVFAQEERELSVFLSPGGTLLQWSSRLQTALPLVRLDGDPQHAGFQFRASQEVPDKTKAETFYIRPDGVGEPGRFRNWPQSPDHQDLPWNALSFVLDDKRYTCCYLNHPQNPRDSRFSERDYGRFGAYFAYDLTPQQPLEIQYRIWLQEGAMSVAEIQRRSDDFTHPVQANVQGTAGE